jgi:Rieske Fe-S protein
MKNQVKPSVESTQDSAKTNTTTSSGMFANVPVTAGTTNGTGNYHIVWPKKDLLGTPSRMAEKADDKVVNKGEIMKDPETGQDIYLIRVHRGKRVWYGKQLVQAQPVEAESAE